MLSLFPELLFLAPFSALLLRLAAGIAFAGIAMQIFKDAEQMKNIPLPIIGVPPQWLILLGGSAVGVVGVSLIIGYATQLAAIGGLLTVALRLGLGKRYDAVCPLVYSTQVFLFIICLSLLLTGPGPFAFDLPL